MLRGFTSPNGLTMVVSTHFNWEVERTYRDGTGPLVYTISCGDMDEMFTCMWFPKKKILSIVSTTRSRMRFAFDTIEEAEKVVLALFKANKVEIQPLYLKENGPK